MPYVHRKKYKQIYKQLTKKFEQFCINTKGTRNRNKIQWGLFHERERLCNSVSFTSSPRAENIGKW